MSEKKLVPKLRFSEFNSIWNKEKLQNCCKIKHGFAFKGEFFSDTPTKDVVVTPGNFKIGGGFQKEKLRYYTGEIPKEYILNPDDLIITMTDLSKKGDTLGYSALVPEDEITYLHNQRIGLVESINHEKIIKNYINWLLRTNKYHHYIICNYTGSSVKHTSPKTILNYEFYLPSIREQMKISSFLDKINNKIVLLEKKHKNYLDFKKYLMQQIFTQKLNFDFTGEWEEKYVNEIFDITRGEVIAKTLIRDSPNEEYCYPVFSSQTTNNGIMGYYNDFDFDGKFITWTTDGANAGKTVYRNGKFKCSNVCGVLKAKSKYSGFANRFIAEYLDSITYKYVSYVGNPKLMNNVMAKIKIKYPPLEEQKKISNLFESVDLSIEIIQNQKENVEKYKKGLLQQMFV